MSEKIVTSTGVVLELNKLLTEYGKSIGIVVFDATFPDGYRTFIAYKDGSPVYESQRFEDICVHIDIWKLDRKLNAQD